MISLLDFVNGPSGGLVGTTSPSGQGAVAVDIGPGDLVSTSQENCCPSAGSHLSAHREDDVSAVMAGARPCCRGEEVSSPLASGGFRTGLGCHAWPCQPSWSSRMRLPQLACHGRGTRHLRAPTEQAARQALDAWNRQRVGKNYPAIKRQWEAA